MNTSSFLLGLVLGLALAAGAWFLWEHPSDLPEANDAPPPPREDAPAPERTPLPPLTLPAPVTLTGRETEAATFPGGEAVLGIGDGYVFGEDRTRPRARAEQVDLLCLEIGRRTSARLRAPHGARAAQMPVVYDRERPAAGEAYARVSDAPLHLEPATIEMRASTSNWERAVLLVRGRDGRSWKLLLTDVEGAENAIERRVHLRYAEVPAARDGGRVVLPGGVYTRGVPVAEAAAIDALLVVPALLRASSLSSLPETAWQAVDDLPVEAASGAAAKLVLTRLGHSVELHSSIRGLVVRGGIPTGATLSSVSGVVLIVDGHLDGQVDAGGFAFVRVRGDVRGTLKIMGQSRVIIDGDVTGSIQGSGIHTILVQGRVANPEEGLQLRGIDQIYHRGYLDRATIARFGGIRGITELHLEDSDLAPQEEPYRIRPWQKVHVGEAIWAELPR